MNYVGNVIRPPSEADSIILQVTVGCSHNRCTFCGAYKDQEFRYKDEQVVARDLAYAAAHYPDNKRLFLADGDVLSISQKRLVALLTEIRQALPKVSRIRLYGNAKGIRNKSLADLSELKALGLDRVYMGLESGDDSVLSAVRKGSTSEQMIAAAQKVREAGIFLSVTVLLGLGGVAGSTRHAQATAAVLNDMAPNHIAALTLMPVPGTSLHEEITSNSFAMPGKTDLLKELGIMLKDITVERALFHANHASNYLPIECRLPQDKDKILAWIDMAANGQVPLMPDYMRGL